MLEPFPAHILCRMVLKTLPGRHGSVMTWNRDLAPSADGRFAVFSGSPAMRHQPSIRPRHGRDLCCIPRRIPALAPLAVALMLALPAHAQETPEAEAETETEATTLDTIQVIGS